LVIFGVARLELTAPTTVDDAATADIEITAAINVDKITFFITIKNLKLIICYVPP
jgi:predicted secreted protein